MLERLDRQIEPLTLLASIFPEEPSCLRLVRALAVEIHEEWVDENRYLDMKLLREHLKRNTAPAAHLLNPRESAFAEPTVGSLRKVFHPMPADASQPVESACQP